MARRPLAGPDLVPLSRNAPLYNSGMEASEWSAWRSQFKYNGVTQPFCGRAVGRPE